MAYSQYDRGDYRPQFGGFRFFPPVIKYLLITNGLLWALLNMLRASALTVGDEPAYIWMVRTFYLIPLGDGFRPWQLVSYMFLHEDFLHLFFNMLMLWMFGMEVENTWNPRRFAWYYLACGVGGGVANLLIAPLFTSVAPTLGASGAVYGVLVAFAMLFPDRHVYFYFLYPIRAKYFILIFIAIGLLLGGGGGSNVAHLAHLGGALTGMVWLFPLVRAAFGGTFRDLAALLRRIGLGRPQRPRTAPPRSAPPRDPAIIDMPAPPKRPADPADDPAHYQRVIDEILDKISTSGYGSLTEREKRILLEASRRIHPDKGAGDR